MSTLEEVTNDVLGAIARLKNCAAGLDRAQDRLTDAGRGVFSAGDGPDASSATVRDDIRRLLANAADGCLDARRQLVRAEDHVHRWLDAIGFAAEGRSVPQWNPVREVDPYARAQQAYETVEAVDRHFEAVEDQIGDAADAVPGGQVSLGVDMPLGFLRELFDALDSEGLMQILDWAEPLMPSLTVVTMIAQGLSVLANPAWRAMAYAAAVAPTEQRLRRAWAEFRDADGEHSAVLAT